MKAMMDGRGAGLADCRGVRREPEKVFHFSLPLHSFFLCLGARTPSFNSSKGGDAPAHAGAGRPGRPSRAGTGGRKDAQGEREQRERERASAAIARSHLFLNSTSPPPAPPPFQYAPGEPVTLWVNKVGPYDNPTLTFNYHALPYCRPAAAEGTKPAKRFGGLGEVLTGNDLLDSQLRLTFREPLPSTPVCTQTLSDRDAAAFTKAVARRYWYELFLDDLPAWGFVGPALEKGAGPDGSPPPPSIFTHQAFTVAVNGDRIVGVTLKTEQPVPIAPGATLAFSYSVAWADSATPFARRFGAYLDAAFFEHRVHAFAVLNAAALVLVLVGLTAGVLVKALRADFRRYEGDLDALERAAGGGGPGAASASAASLGEESGWKAVHGDVFRAPRRPELLSALTGAGAQLAALAGGTVLAAAGGDLFEDRGAITSVAIAAYAVTALLGGAVSGSHYARLGGRRWVRTALLTSAAFPTAIGGIGLALNALATLYGSLAAVSFTAAAAVGSVWLLCAVSKAERGRQERERGEEDRGERGVAHARARSKPALSSPLTSHAARPATPSPPHTNRPPSPSWAPFWAAAPLARPPPRPAGSSGSPPPSRARPGGCRARPSSRPRAPSPFAPSSWRPSSSSPPSGLTGSTTCTVRSP